MLRFNGQVNTGITIRTVHLEEGQAQVRVGATVLCDSIPEEEERETRTKAEAFINAVLGVPAEQRDGGGSIAHTGCGKKVLFVDNRDSFAHARETMFGRRGLISLQCAPVSAQSIRRGGSRSWSLSRPVRVHRGIWRARSGARVRATRAARVWCMPQTYRAW